MICFRLRQFGEQRGGAFAEDLVELFRVPVPRALHVLHGDLQREKRILQFVRQAAGQFAPCGHALGLHQPLALLHQLVRHAIEGPGQLADLVGGCGIDGRSPIAGGDLPALSASRRTGRVTRAVAHQPKASPSRIPVDRHERCRWSAARLRVPPVRAASCPPAGSPSRLSHSPGSGSAWNVSASTPRAYRAGDGGRAARLRLFDERTDAQQVAGPAADQLRGRELRLQVAIEQRPHARRQHQGGEELPVQLLPADDIDLAVACHCGR